MADRRAFDISAPATPVQAINVAGVRAFIVLNLIGGIGMLLVLLTAILSRRVKRLSTWYSFCFSWILSSISYSLLSFAGQQTTSTPSYWLCYIQAALIYSMPPTTTCTTLALLVHILLSFPDTAADIPLKINLRTSCLLLMGPYSIFLVMFIGVTLYETRNPAMLWKAPQGTYCDSMNADWSRISSIVVAAVSMVIIIVQGQLAARLYSNLHSLRRDSQSFATIFRGMLFTVIGFITLVIAMVFTITNDHTLAFDMIISLFPLLALFVFGSQKDLYQAWFSWESPYKAEGRGSVFFGRKLVQ
ncbi:hypothetical protein GALMADRAFT_229023 [Galerina marginata CBS 339.88]|uniref:G-protein coupled receptors family 1 profile domain-containing protein n=1 Tax=Galerina marginata (strain CBS 339.88) TaxID=685588 RepID=A0A067SRT5_GALM3|nr:hypothetical protein GALMADRAFT_229023 [Galerina marginata CBS 339.88]